MKQESIAQYCIQDSNFYSITYNGNGNNFIKDAVISTSGEIVTLGQFDAFSGFVSKFTSQGNVIWSNEFLPDYPHESWVQYPWYSNTEMLGLAAGLNDTYFTFGSSIEHGKSINNIETPPAHRVGLIFQFDKYGNKITARYFGNWQTDYSVTNLIQLPNGNLVVYLRSFFIPKISKVVCVNLKGDIIWAAPIQPTTLVYTEINGANPVIQQLANGNIVIAQIMQRNIADTIFYPFTPPIIIPAPIHYFHLFELDGKNGKLIWETSYQCPTLTNTNVSNTFIPQLKSITELPNGNISFLADMYLPLDSNERFYAYKVFTRRAVNFITTYEGFNLKLISYFPANGSCSLQNAKASGTNGEQLLVTKDSATGKTILLKIDAAGKIIWNKSYANSNPSENSINIAVEKNQGKGYFVFQSDPAKPDINLTITDAAGNSTCTELPVTMSTVNGNWPWLVNKIRITDIPINIDFRYSPFIIKQNSFSLTKKINCESRHICCTDFIDSLHPYNISLCDKEIFRLPDSTSVSNSGQYYAILKTSGGCDSVLFYNIKKIKSPSELSTTPDTCLKNAVTIQLRASDGYDSYLWNNITNTSLPYFSTNRTGDFTVKVENKCGVKIDTIHVYADCEFPIFFPNAFTPNNDLINDVLKIPPVNKNIFLRLSIFNRYGQVIYKSDKVKEGWDGTYRGIPQETGIYIYFLEMIGFSGKPLTKKGTVVLIR